MESVSHVRGWVLLSNGTVHTVQLLVSPKSDGALSNWMLSRLDLSVPLRSQDLSVPLGSQHNKFCYITPITQNTHCFRSAIFRSVPAQVGTHNCQFPTCRYNTSVCSFSIVAEYTTDFKCPHRYKSKKTEAW